jgi:uncharacterized 2Fe-2S/4Fe-4S cluster protein (DUF4445 family)
MTDLVRIRLEPLGVALEVERGTPLQDVLFPYGVEFPCGGQADCKGCRVRLVSGELPASLDERLILSASEIEQGWRLACRGLAEADITLDIAQWETVILSDSSTFEFTPREGLGIAVDLGTTTLVAQLLDLANGRVLGVRTALNPQAAWGADVMSRIQFAMTAGGAEKLAATIRGQIGELVCELLEGRASEPPLTEVTIVGNTVMHHLFCGIPVEPLSHVPFEAVRDGLEVFSARDLGWTFAGGAPVRFLPCFGGFVGSDILAGVLAVRMHESDELVALVDLGTNGEIVIGNRERIVCASTAAGPAFEGGRISMGMRASTGAISEVHLSDGRIACHVLGGVEPRGICGSGLVDAVAVGLDSGALAPNGRLPGKGAWVVASPVSITQADVRELQLAKAAIAAGIRIVCRRRGTDPAAVKRLYLAGAFGNYVNRASARRIGLLDFPLELVHPAGNTALLGAKLALFHGDGSEDYSDLRARVEHISLAADPEFMDIYVDEMGFPGRD